MEQPLISVIIPVYKAEPYLERCVNSVREQTYQNLEIILVDDGSPDRCGEMCDAFARKDSRIQVIHKENGGSSSARNAGLDVASGEYIGFVDSDDWIEADMYEMLLGLIREKEARIAACGLQMDFPSGKVAYFNSNYPENKDSEIFTVEDALREVAIAEKITNSACDKLFAKEIFDGLRMKVGIVNEDVEVMPRCLERAGRIVYTPVPYYHYIMTDNSITRGAFKESRFMEVQVSSERVAYYQQNHPRLCDYARAAHVEICLNIIYAARGLREFADRRNELIRQMRKEVSRSTFSLLKKKVKLKYLLFRVNIHLFEKVMAVYYKL